MTSQKLVLFDIDETILKSNGAGRRAISRALIESFGMTFETAPISMSGKTDPQICCEILDAGGLVPAEVQHRLEDTLELYLMYLQEEVEKSDGYRLHEGVRTLIESLHDDSSVRLGLLTGNIEKGARIKLQPFDLNKYFPVGAYGSDSADRMHLPDIAVRRAADEFGIEFKPKEVVIVGDSIFDVRCAKGHGAVSIAVNTGLTSRDALAAEQPDFLFPTLKDTDSVLQAIFS